MTIDKEKENSYPILFENCTEVVWVIGYGGAGKSTLSQVLQEEFGFTRVELGAKVNSSYKRYVSEAVGQPLSILDWIRQEIRGGEERFSQDLLRLHLEENPQDIQASKVVIPSMRSINGLNAIKRMFPNAKHTLIYVKSSRDVRADRIAKRESKDYGLGLMIERDNMEDESGMMEVIKMADIIIENDIVNLDPFILKIRELFNQE